MTPERSHTRRSIECLFLVCAKLWKMPRALGKWRWPIGILGMLVVCAALCPVCLPAIGLWLVMDGDDANHSTGTADVLVVPDSPWLSAGVGVDRVPVASVWISEARAQLVVMTCGPVYGISGCERAQETLAQQGRPRLPLREVILTSSPSDVEAVAVATEISRLGARSAIVLVSPLESRRVNRIYRREGEKRGIAITVVPVSNPYFDPAHWWRLREGRKAVLFELSQWVGIP
jgi:hypothetical protein